jgi:hypothetical protein
VQPLASIDKTTGVSDVVDAQPPNKPLQLSLSTPSGGYMSVTVTNVNRSFIDYLAFPLAPNP